MTIILERSVGDGMLGAIERIYRAENGYGAIVVTEPPGSEEAGRMIVTPVRFESDAPESYLVLSQDTHLHDGPDAGAPTEPRRLDDPADLEAVLSRLGALHPHVEGEDL
jgi:hypothetical protein